MKIPMGGEERFYWFLLAAYPSRFRTEYREAMFELFRSRLQRVRWRKSSFGARARFWSFMLRDLATNAGAERRAALSRRFESTSGAPAPRIPRSKGREQIVDSFIQDLKQSVRRLSQAPGFTVMALLILGLGIGANAAMFSIVDTFLFRGQPWERADELVWIYQDSDGGDPSSSSYPAYLDMAAHDDVFSGATAFVAQRSASYMDESGDAEQVTVDYVTSGYLDVLGMRPSRGRWFTAAEDLPGGEPVAVVSHRAWQTRFGSDPDILGRTLRLSGALVTVVGVGPRGYAGVAPGANTDFWLSISASGPVGGGFYFSTLERRQDHWFMVIARLNTGVTATQAQAAMDLLAQRLGAEYPELNQGRDITVFPVSSVRVHPNMDGSLYPVGGVLMAVAGLVLLIACSNLANLLLARASARGREVAIRLAMGATRGRLVRYLLTESVLLSVAGGFVGVVVAAWAGRVLAANQPPLPVPVTLEISTDVRVFGFALGLSVLTGIAFGLVPALRASRPELVPSLKDSEEALSPRRQGRISRWFSLRNGLVVAQVAASLVLLIGAGLLVRSLSNSQQADVGFPIENLAILQTDLREAGYTGDEVPIFYENFRQRVEALPGVEQAALASRLPLSSFGGSSTLEIEGYEPAAGTGSIEVDWSIVDTNYFETMGIPILHGRGFTYADGPDSEPIVVISEAMARRYYGTPDAVGKRYRYQGAPDSWVRIIGVAADAKLTSPTEEPTPLFYGALARRSSASRLYTIARTAGDPTSTVAMMRQELRSIDSDVPVYQAGTMEDHAAASLALPRTAAGMLGMFGALAVVLAGLGLYAVVAFAVSRRTTEVGVRMALGARGNQVVGMMVKEVMTLVGVGLLVGVVLSLLATPVLGSMLYGVAPTDPVTILAVAVLLTIVAAFAAWLPARRAAGVDPVTALRYQ